MIKLNGLDFTMPTLCIHVVLSLESNGLHGKLSLALSDMLFSADLYSSEHFDHSPKTTF